MPGYILLMVLLTVCRDLSSAIRSIAIILLLSWVAFKEERGQIAVLAIALYGSALPNNALSSTIYGDVVLGRCCKQWL